MKILWFYNDNIDPFIIEERKENLVEGEFENSFIFI